MAILQSMNAKKLSEINHIHFIGIGGIGVSAIARMMLEEGKQVTGTDTEESDITKELEKSGARITYNQNLETIPKKADLIVYTVAIEQYAPHLLERVIDLGLESMSYPEFLGELSKDKFTIAVAGTHGKTTTTAMVAKIMIDAGLDPTVVVGSLMVDSKSNFIAGKSNYLVVEACEYRRSFLNIHPNILVITNIEEDHLDYYKDLKDIQSAFRELVGRVPEDGLIITNRSNESILPVINNTNTRIDNYREEKANMNLSVPGKFNEHNARAALTVARSLGIDEEKIVQSLNEFKGTWRRFEYKGRTKSGVEVYDDYGHHPSEIRETLKAAKEKFETKKLIVVFQPHLYSRTKNFLQEFGESFDLADRIIIAPIYAAREEKDESISSRDLAEIIKERGKTVHYALSLEDITDNLQDLSDDNVVLTIGAGDVFKVADKLVK